MKLTEEENMQRQVLSAVHTLSFVKFPSVPSEQINVHEG